MAQEAFFAVDVVQDLEAERALGAELRSERDNYRRLYADERHKNQQLEEENERLRRQLRGVQQEHALLVAEWEAKLDAKYQELAHMQPNPEADLARRHAMQQLDDDVQNLTASNEKYRKANLELRQELEAFREQYFQQGDVDDIKNELTFLQGRFGELNPTAELRKLRQKATALSLQNSSLLAEIEDVRAQKETALVQHEQAKRLLTRATNEAEANAKSLNAERESFRLKGQKLQEEVHALRREMADLEAKMHSLRQTNVSIKGELTDRAHAHHKEIRELQAQLLNASQGAERASDDLKVELRDARSRVQVLELSLKEAEASITSKDKDSQTSLHRAREEEWKKQRSLQQEKSTLEGRIAVLERELSESRNHNETEELRAVRRELQQRIDQLSGKNHALLEKVAGYEKAARAHDAARQQLKKTEAELRHVQEAHRNLRRTQEKTKAAHDKLEILLENRSQEVVDLQVDLDRQREDHERDLDQTKKLRFRETQNFQDHEMRMQGDAEALMQRLQQALDAAAHHKAQYRKRKAELSGHIQGLELELQNEVKKSEQLQAQVADCTRACECMKKKLEHFRFVLTNEGWQQAAGVMRGPHAIPMPFEQAFASRETVPTADVQERLKTWEAAGELPRRRPAQHGTPATAAEAQA